MDITAIDTSLILGFIFIVGLVFGSFATAVAYRMPLNKNWITGHSKCTACGHNLGILDLFPIISWVLLRGKCRYCHVKFGWAYPMAELCVAFLFTFIAYLYGLTWLSAIIMLLALTLIIMSIIDFEHYIIPDELNLFMLLLGGVYCVIIGTSLEFILLGPILGFSLGLGLRWLMWVWKGKEGLGLGDVKFLAVVGMFLPFNNFPAFLFISGMLGILIAIIWRIRKAGERFPFGPALGMAMLVCVLFPAIGNKWQECITNLVIYLQGA